jgi:hypothetical protein
MADCLSQNITLLANHETHVQANPEMKEHSLQQKLLIVLAGKSKKMLTKTNFCIKMFH